MRKQDCFHFGTVTRTHALKGEVVAHLLADNNTHFKNLESVFVELNNQLVPFFISGISIRGNSAIIKFDDYDSKEEGQKLIKCMLFLPNVMMPEPEEGEVNHHQLVGYAMLDPAGKPLGAIEAIDEYPAQLIIRTTHQGREVLIPMADDFVVQIDHEAKTVTLNLPEGYIDLYLG